MTLAPFYAAPIFVKVHMVAAMVVVVLTPVQFWGLRKGSLAHRISGYLWLAGMLVVAISSFWITSTFGLSIWGFSPIHLFSIIAPYFVFRIIRTARAGALAAHRGHVRGLAIGFWIAGLFTLIPPRVLGRMIFS
jgi:uncharacterized membrane protein